MAKNKKFNKIEKTEKTEEILVFNFKSASIIEKTIYFAAILIILFHVISTFYSSPYAWSVNSLSFLNPVLQVIFILFGIFILFPIGQRSVYSFINYLINIKNRFPTYVLLISVLILTGLILWIFRVKVYALGDASLMFQAVNVDDTETWTSREMLTTRAVAFINNFLKSTGSTSVITSYVIISFISGIIFVVASIQISKLLGKNDFEKFVIFFSLAFSGSSLLFFGYVENYPIEYGFMSLYFLFSIKYLMGKCSIIFPLIFYSIVFLLHMITLALFPTVLFLFYYEFKRKGTIAVFRNVVIVLISLSIFLVLSGNGFTKLINIFSKGWSLVSGNAVPLSGPTGDFSAYTMFSLNHLIDFLNHQLLINPIALFLIVLLIIYQFKSITWKEPIFLFLFMSALFSLGLGFAINHIYGMSKDWDVIAPFVITFSLLSVYLIQSKSGILRNKKWVVSVITGLLFFHTVPYILVYSSEGSAISRSKYLQDERIMPKIGIIVTDMNIAEYFNMKQDYENVAKTYQRLTERYPYDSRGYLLLAKAYDQSLKNIDKAMEITLRAENAGVLNTKLQYNLGHYFFQKKKYDEAIKRWSGVARMDSNYYRVYFSLGSVFGIITRYDSAIINLEKYLMYDTLNYGVYQNLGNCYIASNQYRKAILCFERYMVSNPNDYNVYKNIGICYKNIGDYEKTIRYWTKYLEAAPRNQEWNMIDMEVKKISKR